MCDYCNCCFKTLNDGLSPGVFQKELPTNSCSTPSGFPTPCPAKTICASPGCMNIASCSGTFCKNNPQIKNNNTGNKSKSKCNCGIPTLRSQLGNSTKDVVTKKNELLKQRLDDVKNIAYYPLENQKVNGVFFVKIMSETLDNRKESCSKILNKLKDSKLSFVEKRNLYNNLLSQILSNNNLNLDLYLPVGLKNLGYNDVTKEYIDLSIRVVLEEIIYVIIVNCDYGEEILKYNYAELFNFGYFFITTQLYYNQGFVFNTCLSQIIQDFGKKLS
jgi:hypothetical protein